MVESTSQEQLREHFKGRVARDSLRAYFQALRAKKPAESFGVLSR